MRTQNALVACTSVLTAVLLIVGACSSDGAEAPSTSSTTASTTSSTGAPTLEQPALWPAPDVVFDSPVDAASDFVSQVLGVPPELGEPRLVADETAEIAVLVAREGGGGEPILRSTLTLAELGPDDGWFVVAARNESNVISRPRSADEVPAGEVEVSGHARGFEATVIVEAFIAGEPSRIVQQITQGGAGAISQPYAVTIDLTGIDSGQTVLLIVKGGVGLETDPGEFSAIPVTIE